MGFASHLKRMVASVVRLQIWKNFGTVREMYAYWIKTFWLVRNARDYYNS